MAHGPRLLLLGTGGIEDTRFQDEHRWVAVALVCSLLAPQQGDPVEEVPSPASRNSSSSTLDAEVDVWTERAFVNALCAAFGISRDKALGLDQVGFFCLL